MVMRYIAHYITHCVFVVFFSLSISLTTTKYNNKNRKVSLLYAIQIQNCVVSYLFNIYIFLLTWLITANRKMSKVVFKQKCVKSSSVAMQIAFGFVLH